MSDQCKSCGQEVKQPATTWLTTAEVIEQYKFDPTDDVYNGRLRSKLVRMECGHCRGVVRVWIKDDLDSM